MTGSLLIRYVVTVADQYQPHVCYSRVLEAVHEVTYRGAISNQGKFGFIFFGIISRIVRKRFCLKG